MSTHHWRQSRRLVVLLFAAIALVVLFTARSAQATTGDAIQWTTDVTLAFSPDQMAQPDWEANAQELATGLANRLRARDATLLTRRTIRPNQSLDFQFTMTGRGGLNQFKSVMFDDARPIGGFLGGPATLKLTGNVVANEPLDLVLESNPSTGYSWDIQGMDGTLLQSSAEPELHSKQGGLGAPMHQMFHLRGIASGRTTITLLYHRQWQSEIPTRVITLDAPKLSMLADLDDPTPVELVQPAADHAPLTAGPETTINLPSSFDWRAQGKLTPVRDQGGCGSCWAFSTVGAFEADLLIQNNISSNLSEQYLISCNSNGWSCNGGWFAHDYHVNKLGRYQTAAGAVLETAFPYSATNGTCSKAFTHTYALSSWQYVGSANGVPSIDAIKNAILTYGPVSAAVCVGKGWYNYSGGVFRTDEESACGGGVNHAIVLTGWSDSDHAWVLRNSWGSYWGESGYMRIAYGISNVGFGANYVVGSSQPNVCYSLTTQVKPAGSGTVAVSPAPNCNNGTQYTPGTSVTLTAAPASTYMFKNWTGSVTSTANPLTLKMNGNRSVTANMRLKNMLLNPSMELDVNADGHPDNWTPLANFVRTTAAVESGGYAGRLSAANNGTYRVLQAVSGITGGATYQTSGWFNIPSTTDTFTFNYRVRWLDAYGALIRMDTVQSYTSPTGGWVQAGNMLTAPATARSAQIVFAAINVNATIYIDDMYFGP